MKMKFVASVCKVGDINETPDYTRVSQKFCNISIMLGTIWQLQILLLSHEGDKLEFEMTS